MVDGHLPIEDQPRPLRYIFLDLNSYFASVEQQENPELRGKPVAVVPVMADTSFVIAASYEAKALGVKTLTMIGDAKKLCPDIQLVNGRWPVYSAYHERVLEAVEKVLPIDQVCSIDEVRFKLLGTESPPAVARELGLRLKKIIREEVGEYMSCSVGIAPNAYLAKIGTELQKPDGLVVIQLEDLPHILHKLKLTDFTGINTRMAARLNAAGIFSAEQLCAASKQELVVAFGSIVGEKWWYNLRGFDMASERSQQKTLGHSHVLAPDLRTDQGCRDVLLRLLQKSSARLRASDLWTTQMVVGVHAFKRSWQQRVHLPPTQDTVTLTEYFLEAWESRDFDSPRSVSVTFTELHPAEEVTLSLFDPTQDRSEFNKAIDRINQRFGKNTIYSAGISKSKDAAEEKIAFNKTTLFKEGAGDHEWIDTFRGKQKKKDQ